jgi:hypothetical protein
LIAGFEITKTESVFDLLDELQVGRHAGAGIEPEGDP